MQVPDMKFCTQCGASLDRRIPPGDNLPRHVCPNCGEIHYLNPKIIVGCVAEWEGRLLLCRRAIEPRPLFSCHRHPPRFVREKRYACSSVTAVPEAVTISMLP